MKLIDYLNEACQNAGEDITAIRYYFNGDLEGYESDHFNISLTHLQFEDLYFDLNSQGEVVDHIFKFTDDDGNSIGIELWF